MSDSRGSKAETWTTRKLLAWTTQHFASRGLDHHRLCAEMLLAHVLGVDRLRLYMDPERPASELERAALRDLISRAVAHEPVDYLVGRTPFFSMMLQVNSHVLIPRPSTETLVEHVIQHARRTPGFHAPLIADIGTGSGAIAIALAKHVPHSRLIATDISQEALQLAQINAREQNVADSIEWRQGDLLAPLDHQSVRYLVSNPPYISDVEWDQVLPNVRNFEPHLALRAGADGLKYLRPLIERASQHLLSPGQLIVEIAASQKDAVLRLAEESGLTNARVLADHEGLPRVLVAERL